MDQSSAVAASNVLNRRTMSFMAERLVGLPDAAKRVNAQLMRVAGSQ
jgi:hypothetical protein